MINDPELTEADLMIMAEDEKKNKELEQRALLKEKGVHLFDFDDCALMKIELPHNSTVSHEKLAHWFVEYAKQGMKTRACRAANITVQTIRKYMKLFPKEFEECTRIAKEAIRDDLWEDLRINGSDNVKFKLLQAIAPEEFGDRMEINQKTEVNINVIRVPMAVDEENEVLPMRIEDPEKPTEILLERRKDGSYGTIES